MRLVAIAVALAACGRVGFDPLSERTGDASDSATIDGAVGDAAAGSCATFGPWSAPQTDATLNATATDWGPQLSHDQLTLTFASNRGGANDAIYQAARATIGAPWQTPVAIGVSGDDPWYSPDALELYVGANGVTRYTRTTVVSDWMNRGDPAVADATFTVLGGPYLTPDSLTLLFTGTKVSDGLWHEYVATRATTAATFGVASEVAGIDSAVGEAFGSFRGDALELVYENESGAGQISTASRVAVDDPFGGAHVITELAAAGNDGDPDLSDDGATLWFASTRAGGLGDYDLWFSTRSCL